MRSHRGHLVRGLMCPNFQRLLWCCGKWKPGAAEKPAEVALGERDAVGDLDEGGGTGDRSNREQSVMCGSH